MSEILEGPDVKTMEEIRKELGEDPERFANNLAIFEKWVDCQEHLPRNYGEVGESTGMRMKRSRNFRQEDPPDLPEGLQARHGTGKEEVSTFLRGQRSYGCNVCPRNRGRRAAFGDSSCVSDVTAGGF